jgi:hypothetical protein
VLSIAADLISLGGFSTRSGGKRTCVAFCGLGKQNNPRVGTHDAEHVETMGLDYLMQQKSKKISSFDTV